MREIGILSFCLLFTSGAWLGVLLGLKVIKERAQLG